MCVCVRECWEITFTVSASLLHLQTHGVATETVAWIAVAPLSLSLCLPSSPLILSLSIAFYLHPPHTHLFLPCPTNIQATKLLISADFKGKVPKGVGVQGNNIPFHSGNGMVVGRGGALWADSATLFSVPLPRKQPCCRRHHFGPQS